MTNARDHMNADDRAAIAYNALLDFLIKAELDREILPRLLDLVMAGYTEEAGNGNRASARMLDEARQYVFDMMHTDVNGQLTNTESYPQLAPRLGFRGLTH